MAAQFGLIPTEFQLHTKTLSLYSSITSISFVLLLIYKLHLYTLQAYQQRFLIIALCSFSSRRKIEDRQKYACAILCIYLCGYLFQCSLFLQMASSSFISSLKDFLQNFFITQNFFLGLLLTQSLSLCLSGNILNYLLCLNDSFAGYRIHG